MTSFYCMNYVCGHYHACVHVANEVVSQTGSPVEFVGHFFYNTFGVPNGKMMDKLV
jgi:hypothetical protein